MDSSYTDPRDMIELDEIILAFGSNLNKLVSKDPVNEQILGLVREWAQEPDIVHYTKVNFIKLDSIHKAKASNVEDAQLASLMQTVSLAQADERAHLPSPETTCEKTIRDCIEQLQWLSKRNIDRKVVGTYKQIIKLSGYRIPSAINSHNIDDLTAILVATTSDSIYKANPVTTLLPVGNRFRMNVIIHLALIGGKPANSHHFYSMNHVTFSAFMRKISDTVVGGRRLQPKRLGYLNSRQMERGVWLSQAAADMESLDLQRNAWQIVEEASYKALLEIKDKHVFLIHEYQLGMPERIEEKARTGPKSWNTWALHEHPSATAPPAPEFLPAAEGPTIAPGSHTMTVLSGPRPRPQGPLEQEKEATKKEKKKERKEKRGQLKLALRGKQ